MSNLKLNKKGIGIYYMPYIFVFIIAMLLITVILFVFFYVNTYYLNPNPNSYYSLSQISTNPTIDFEIENILKLNIQKSQSDKDFYELIKQDSGDFLNSNSDYENYFKIVDTSSYKTYGDLLDDYIDKFSTDKSYFFIYHTNYDIIYVVNSVKFDQLSSKYQSGCLQRLYFTNNLNNPQKYYVCGYKLP